MAAQKSVSQDIVDEFVLQSHHSYGKVRRFLIEHPDLVQKRSTWGETALDAARHAGKSDIVQFLLSAGAKESDCPCLTGDCQAPIERLNLSQKGQA